MRLLFLLLLTFTLNCLYGQNPYSQNLGSLNGLASNNVYFSFQDREGYMWFGTDMGVSRFNGYEFENFSALDGMLGNEIFSIHQDQKGRIWFLSLNGELTFYLSGDFHNSKNDSLLSQFKSDKHWSSFVEDRITGDIYITSISNGLYKLDQNDELDFHDMNSQIFSVWQNKENEICFFSANKGILRIEDEHIRQVEALDFSENYVRTTYIKDALYIGYQDKVYRYSDSLKLYWDSSDNAEIIWLSSDSKNNLVIGTRDGLRIESDNHLSFVSNFEGYIVSSTLFDEEGNYWVTTIGQGIFISPSSEIKLVSKEIDNLQVTSVKYNENSKSIWLGLVNGNYCSYKEDSTSVFAPPRGNQPITSIRTFGDSVFVSSKQFFGVIQSGRTDFVEYLSNDILLTDKWVYIASNKLFKLDKMVFDNLVNGDFSADAIEKQLLEHNIYSNTVNVLCKGKNSDVYVGTRNSLMIENANGITDLSLSNDLLSTSIYDLVYDSTMNFLYVATFSNGVLVLENNAVIYTLNENTGLSSNNCQALKLDINGNLWVGTSKGLDKLSLNNGKPEIENFSRKIGLADMKCSDIEVAENTIYLATDIGLIVCPASGINKKKSPPTVELSSILINGVARPNQELMALNHNQNSLTFQFQGLSMRDLGNLTYKYRLKGYQSIWKTTKNRIVTYESLESGSYDFQVKAINGDGIESNISNRTVKIYPVYWKTLWFIGLIVGLLVFVLIIIWRIKSNGLREKYGLEKQIVAAEMEKLKFEKAYLQAEQKAGVLQMNPHFLFNSLNAIKGFYAEGKTKEGNRFLVKFSKLLRNILECNTQFIPLEKEIEILSIYLELMRKRHGDFFNFKIESSIPSLETIEIPPMLLQPIVENAVIHGVSPKKSGDILVTFTTEKNELVCTVFDNGIGFEKSVKTPHNSIGISSIRHRLDLLSRQLNFKCELKILNKPESEYITEIRIRLPLKTNK